MTGDSGGFMKPCHDPALPELQKYAPANEDQPRAMLDECIAPQRASWGKAQDGYSHDTEQVLVV